MGCRCLVFVSNFPSYNHLLLFYIYLQVHIDDHKPGPETANVLTLYCAKTYGDPCQVTVLWCPATVMALFIQGSLLSFHSCPPHLPLEPAGQSSLSWISWDFESYSVELDLIERFVFTIFLFTNGHQRRDPYALRGLFFFYFHWRKNYWSRWFSRFSTAPGGYQLFIKEVHQGIIFFSLDIVYSKRGIINTASHWNACPLQKEG